MLEPNFLKPWFDLLTVYGGTTVLFCSFLYFWIRYMNYVFEGILEKKWKGSIKKVREIHEQLDKEENDRSKQQMRSIQKYLEDHAPELFSMGVDRVNVWVNHNGTRIGKFHFIFYSLIAEIVNRWAKSFGYSHLQWGHLPYYIFSDYEDEINRAGFVFRQREEFTGAAKAMAEDFGTLTLYWVPLNSINGSSVSGILFFSAVHSPLKEIPNVEIHAANIRALLI